MDPYRSPYITRKKTVASNFLSIPSFFANPIRIGAKALGCEIYLGRPGRHTCKLFEPCNDTTFLPIIKLLPKFP